jgi:hydrogenase expression/formation protein HypC
MKILKIENDQALCELGETEQLVSLALMDPQPEPGQYLMVHAGFAINIINEEEARNNLELLQELADFHGEMLEAEEKEELK